jgi:glycerophosphoryl diester phosphodiesterase
VVSGDPRGYIDLVTPAGLAEIATYADGVGPWKRYIISGAMEDLNHNGEADDDVNGDGQVNDADRKRTAPTSLVDDAHAAGLLVHTWTFRNEARFLLGDYGDDPVQEYFDFYCLGVDGLFADFPDTAITARALFADAPQPVCKPWK